MTTRCSRSPLTAVVVLIALLAAVLAALAAAPPATAATTVPGTWISTWSVKSAAYPSNATAGRTVGVTATRLSARGTRNGATVTYRWYVDGRQVKSGTSSTARTDRAPWGGGL